MTLRKLMKFGEIVDDDLLAKYEVYLRKSNAAQGFRNLVNLTWDESSRRGNKSFTYSINCTESEIQELLSEYTIKLPENLSPPNLPAPVDNPVVEAPTLKKRRISKAHSYTPATLAKYSKESEKKFLDILASDFPSATNLDLQRQIVDHIISRLQLRFHGTEKDSCSVNNSIVNNIKELVTSMTKYGRNDREQIRFKENIALAVSGKVALLKLMEATGLGRRQIENGKKMR